MDESAMLRGLIDMILNNTCLNYEHKDLIKEIGEEKDGI